VRIRLALIASVAAALTLPVTASSTPSFPVSTGFAGCDAGPNSCRIDVSFSPVAGAEGYAASAHMPDGGSQSLGSITPGSSTVTVPYRGNGTYVVTITALGRGVVEAQGSQASR
jgi:hypothetical protein